MANLLEGIPDERIEAAVFAICVLYDSGVRSPEEIRAYLKQVFCGQWRVQ
jgi:hypothetical protein